MFYMGNFFVSNSGNMMMTQSFVFIYSREIEITSCLTWPTYCIL